MTSKTKATLSGLQERLNAIKEYRESQAPAGIDPESAGERSSTGWTSPPSTAPGPIGSLSGDFRSIDDQGSAQSSGQDVGAVEQPTPDESAVETESVEKKQVENSALSESEASVNEASVGPSLSHMMAQPNSDEPSAPNLKATQDFDEDEVLSNSGFADEKIEAESASENSEASWEPSLPGESATEEPESTAEPASHRFETQMEPPPDVLTNSGEQSTADSVSQEPSMSNPAEGAQGYGLSGGR